MLPGDEKPGAPFRLTGLGVQRFRSLYELDLPLKPLNILVGPNGSGKSNLVGLLRFVRDVASDPQAGQKYRRIARDLVWYGQEDGEPVYAFSVTLTFSYAAAANRLRYTVDVSTVEKELIFPREVLENTQTFLSRLQNRAEIREAEEISGPAIFTIDRGALALQYLSPLTRSQAIRGAQHTIARWRFFDIDTHLARQSTADVSLRPVNVPGLGSDAANLSEFLYALQAVRPEDLAEVIERLRNAVEFLDDVGIETRPALLDRGGEASYRIQERAFPTLIPPDSVSEGTIRLLALLALLVGDRSPSLVCLEEPDHNLHPHLMLHLADAMRYAATAQGEHPQLIVTTHSPDFLDCFDPDGEAEYLNVFVVSKDPLTGKSGCRLVDSARLAHWLSEYRLGDLHKMGLLDSYARGER